MCVIAGFGSRQPQRGGRVLSQRRLPGAAPARRPVHSRGFSLLLYTPRRKAGLPKAPSVSRASTRSVLCTSATQTETLGDDNRSLLFVINRQNSQLFDALAKAKDSCCELPRWQYVYFNKKVKDLGYLRGRSKCSSYYCYYDCN